MSDRYSRLCIYLSFIILELLLCGSRLFLRIYSFRNFIMIERAVVIYGIRVYFSRSDFLAKYSPRKVDWFNRMPRSSYINVHVMNVFCWFLLSSLEELQNFEYHFYWDVEICFVHLWKFYVHYCVLFYWKANSDKNIVSGGKVSRCTTLTLLQFKTRSMGSAFVRWYLDDS